MTELRQREPRVEYPAYLAYIRTLPCLACGKAPPSDPAHLRSASLEYGKRLTGKAEKPDDRWTLPLCRDDHEAQHRQNELTWWASVGLADPFAVAVSLYEGRPAMPAPRQVLHRDKPAEPRKPKAERRKVAQSQRPIPARPLESRPTVWPSRPFPRKSDLNT
jgi:hypothetical protein